MADKPDPASGVAPSSPVAPASPQPEPAGVGAVPAATPSAVSPAASTPAGPDPAGIGVTAAGVAAEPPKQPEIPQPAPTLLETLGKDADKPKPAEGSPPAPADIAKASATADAKPGGEPPAEPPKPAEPAKLEPVEYAYTLPEALKLDDSRKGELHAAFDAFRADPAKGAQGLLDLHNKAMQEFADNTLINQHKAFADMRKTWRDGVMSDPELGGAGHHTAMGAVARMRDLFLSDPDPNVQARNHVEFNDALRITGAGDHPAILRLLHRAAKFFDEADSPPPDARPPPDIHRNPNRGNGFYSEESRARMNAG